MSLRNIQNLTLLTTITAIPPFEPTLFLPWINAVGSQFLPLLCFCLLYYLFSPQQSQRDLQIISHTRSLLAPNAAVISPLGFVQSQSPHILSSLTSTLPGTLSSLLFQTTSPGPIFQMLSLSGTFCPRCLTPPPRGIPSPNHIPPTGPACSPHRSWLSQFFILCSTFLFSMALNHLLTCFIFCLLLPLFICLFPCTRI